jgi:precorrin-2 dehydrogenase / sirohydrochlorin ferrochelatase
MRAAIGRECVLPKYYPVMLDIRDRLAIVVGGNALAAEKVAALVASGAHVRVIAMEFSAELLALAEQEKITLQRKAYATGDLAGAFVVVAVATEQKMIEAIWQETQQHGQPVNIADVPQYCSFILPSILRRGHLTIAVSTEGASPGLAKRIRQQLEETFSPAYGAYVDLAALARRYLRQQGVSYQARDEFVQDLVNSQVLALLGAGEVRDALQVTAELLHLYDIEIAISELEREFVKEQGHDASEH